MKIKGVRNERTGEIIYSRTNHDYHEDSAKEIFVDGQGDRFGWNAGVRYSLVEFELPVTKNELFSDWNHQRNQFGWLNKTQIEAQGIEIRTLRLVEAEVAGGCPRQTEGS